MDQGEQSITDNLAEALRNMLGPQPDKYGFGAARQAMDPAVRKAAMHALEDYDMVKRLGGEFQDCIVPRSETNMKG